MGVTNANYALHQLELIRGEKKPSRLTLRLRNKISDANMRFNGTVVKFIDNNVSNISNKLITGRSLLRVWNSSEVLVKQWTSATCTCMCLEVFSEVGK